MFYVDNDVMICQTRLSWLQTRSVLHRTCLQSGGVGWPSISSLGSSVWHHPGDCSRMIRLAHGIADLGATVGADQARGQSLDDGAQAMDVVAGPVGSDSGSIRPRQSDPRPIHRGAVGIALMLLLVGPGRRYSQTKKKRCTLIIDDTRAKQERHSI